MKQAKKTDTKYSREYINTYCAMQEYYKKQLRGMNYSLIFAMCCAAMAILFGSLLLMSPHFQSMIYRLTGYIPGGWSVTTAKCVGRYDHTTSHNIFHKGMSSKNQTGIVLEFELASKNDVEFLKSKSLYKSISYPCGDCSNIKSGDKVRIAYKTPIKGKFLVFIADDKFTDYHDRTDGFWFNVLIFLSFGLLCSLWFIKSYRNDKTFVSKLESKQTPCLSVRKQHQNLDYPQDPNYAFGYKFENWVHKGELPANAELQNPDRIYEFAAKREISFSKSDHALLLVKKFKIAGDSKVIIKKFVVIEDLGKDAHRTGSYSLSAREFLRMQPPRLETAKSAMYFIFGLTFLLVLLSLPMTDFGIGFR